MHLVPAPINVRCYSNSNPIVRRSKVTLRANSGLMHRSKSGELGVNTPSLLDKTQAVSCRCHQPECPLSSGYPDFLGSFLDLSNPGIDLVLSDRTHRMINDDGLKVRHAKSLSG